MDIIKSNSSDNSLLEYLFHAVFTGSYLTLNTLIKLEGNGALS
jgi:hypothetical protein